MTRSPYWAAAATPAGNAHIPRRQTRGQDRNAADRLHIQTLAEQRVHPPGDDMEIHVGPRRSEPPYETDAGERAAEFLLAVIAEPRMRG